MIIRKTIFILLLLVCSSPSFSQVIDSLADRLNKTELDYEKVDLWNEISNQQQPIGGKDAAQNALTLAKEINYPKGEADANYFLGSYNYLKDKQDLAKVHMLRAIAIYDSLDLQSEKAETLAFLGEILYFDKNYSTALQYIQKAEHIAIQINDKTLLGLIYEAKALIYMDGLGDKELGKLYLLKGNSIFKETEDLAYLIENQLRIATFYVENNKVDSSLLFIKQGEASLTKLNSSKLSTQVYMKHNFSALKGTCYSKTEKIDTAKLFIEQCLPFFIKNENWYSVAWAYTDLSLIALKKKNYQESISYAKKSIELDFTEFSIKENTKLIRDAFKALNQDSFHIYNEKYIALLANNKDIINASEIQEILKEEKLHKKEEELHKKEEELISEKNNSKNIIFGIFLLIVAYRLVLLFFYKTKKSKKVSSSIKETRKTDLIPPNKDSEIDELRQKVHTIERSLLSKEIDIERQRSSLDHTTQHLKEIATQNNPIDLKKSIQRLSNQLEHQNNNNQWVSFTQQFERIHPIFFDRLRVHAPNLSTRETRLCAYGKLGMTNQEIAQILGIETSSVSKARHRLKKKMNLKKEQDLNHFLLSL